MAHGVKGKRVHELAGLEAIQLLGHVDSSHNLRGSMGGSEVGSEVWSEAWSEAHRVERLLWLHKMERIVGRLLYGLWLGVG